MLLTGTRDMCCLSGQAKFLGTIPDMHRHVICHRSLQPVKVDAMIAGMLREVCSNRRLGQAHVAGVVAGVVVGALAFVWRDGGGGAGARACCGRGARGDALLYLLTQQRVRSKSKSERAQSPRNNEIA